VQIVSADLLFIALVLVPDLFSADRGKSWLEWVGLNALRFCFVIPEIFFVSLF